MDKEEKLLKGRLIDLSKAAQRGKGAAFSDFLSPYELGFLLSIDKRELSCEYAVFAEGMDLERRVVAFGEVHGDADFDVKLLKIEPKNAKYVANFSHRDILGSLMGLSLRREMIGDIFLKDGSAFVFTKDKVADFIIENLQRVGKTDVKISAADFSAGGFERKLAGKKITAPSRRLDAVLSAVYNLPRSESAELIEGEKAFVNAKCVVSPACILKDGDIVSLRAYGKFILDSDEGENKKGRLRLNISVYV